MKNEMTRIAELVDDTLFVSTVDTFDEFAANSREIRGFAEVAEYLDNLVRKRRFCAKIPDRDTVEAVLYSLVIWQEGVKKLAEKGIYSPYAVDEWMASATDIDNILLFFCDLYEYDFNCA